MRMSVCVYFKTHVETVSCGTPYFAETSLFVISFSKSFKALYFSAKDLLFVSFCLTGAIFCKKKSDENYLVLFCLQQIE